jgi:hypothetical protein
LSKVTRRAGTGYKKGTSRQGTRIKKCSRGKIHDTRKVQEARYTIQERFKKQVTRGKKGAGVMKCRS